MSFREVIMAMQGHNNYQEAIEQQAWERLRWQTTLLLNVHTAKGKSLKPTDLVEFPWEVVKPKDVHRKLTDDEVKIFEKWDKL
jgi:hypothetical protein